MTLLEERPPTVLQEPSAPVLLMTERLVLRAPRLDDAPALATLINDRRIAENTSQVPHPYTLADAQAWLTAPHRSEGQASFLVTLDGNLIGGCGVMHPRGPIPEIGYWFGVAFWGQGYATEAAHAVIDHAFTDLGNAALQAGARVSNPASRRVLEKCGFQWTGVMLMRSRALKSSAPVDRFRLDRGLWASLKNWGTVKRLG
jgi:RimJ/RimL family protein N-acetyltransferase